MGEIDLAALDDTELTALHDAVHVECQSRSERAAISRELADLSRRWVNAGGAPGGVVAVLQQAAEPEPELEPEPVPVPVKRGLIKENTDGPNNA